MINFFRKIKYSSNTKSKLRKYFFIPIKDILLIVISIVIALHVNNWKENREKERLRSDYLESLVIALKEDISMLNIGINVIIKDSLKVNQIIKRLRKPDSNFDTLLKIARNEFDSKASTISGFYDNTYDALLTTRDIDLFDPWLHKSLMRINMIHNESLLMLNLSINYYTSTYNLYTQKYTLKQYNFLNKELYNLIWEDVDKREFVADFNGFISKRVEHNKTILNSFNFVKRETEIVLDSISKKLLNKKD